MYRVPLCFHCSYRESITTDNMEEPWSRRWRNRQDDINHAIKPVDSWGFCLLFSGLLHRDNLISPFYFVLLMSTHTYYSPRSSKTWESSKMRVQVFIHCQRLASQLSHFLHLCVSLYATHRTFRFFFLSLPFLMPNTARPSLHRSRNGGWIQPRSVVSKE